MVDLTSPRLKVARARVHLAELLGVVQPYLAAGVGHIYYAGDDDVWSVFRFRLAAPLPDGLGVIAGDVAHNARCALDHLVWEMVRDNGASPGDHNSFPIVHDEKRWRTVVALDVERDRKSPLLGVSSSCEEAVARFQAFHPACTYMKGWHPLERLASLDNLDKHRGVQSGLVNKQQAIPRVKGKFDLDWLSNGMVETPKGPLVDDCEIARMQRVAAALFGINVERDVTFVQFIEVAFGDGLVSTRDLGNMIAYVERVIAEVASTST